MTRDDIIRMAREAGMPSLSLIDIGYLEKFAALVAAAEREACTKVCELIDTSAFGTERPAPNDCAAAIRAREA